MRKHRNKSHGLTAVLFLASLALFILVGLLVYRSQNVTFISVSAFFMYTSFAALIIYRQKWDDYEKPNLFASFFTAYFIRFMIAVLSLDAFLASKNVDQLTYLQFGDSLINSGSGNPITAYANQGIMGNTGFFIFVASHLKISSDPLFIATTNTFLSALCVFFIFRIGKHVAGDKYDSKTLLLGAWLYSLFPLSIYWSIPILKESSSVFLCVFFIDQLFQFQNGKILFPAIIMTFILVILASLRVYLAPMLLASAIISILILPRKKFKLIVASVFIFIIFSAVFLLFWNQLTQSKSLGYMLLTITKFVKYDTFANVSHYRTNFANVAVSDVDKTHFTSLFDMIKFFPTGLLRTLTTPVRWFRPDMDFLDKVYVVCTAVWYLMMPFTFIGAYEWMKRYFRKSSSIFIFLFLLMLYFSMMLLGGAGRQLSTFYPFFCMFAAIMIPKWKSIMPFVMSVYIILGVMVASAELSAMMTIIVLAPSILTILIVLLYTTHVNEKAVSSRRGI
jgi:hypothetical protein